MNKKELKFRVWIKSLKRFGITSNLYVSADGNKIAGSETMDSVATKYYSLPIDDYLIQQSTGLKDKNGREIYEGDFCNRENWSGNPYYVRYSKDGWFWRRHNETDEEFLKYRDCFYDSDRLRNGIENCEIIGNIFENPELLK